MTGVKDSIRQFIVATYLPGESLENLRDDTPLVTSGILDSLAMMTVVSFIEKQFDIELDVYDTSVERFDTLGSIVATVLHKISARAASAK